MTINIQMPDNLVLKPSIAVLGVGGAGGNAVNNMINAKLQGAKFFVANTDAQALEYSLVDEDKRIQLGPNTTSGLGAGAVPGVGQLAAEESIEEIMAHLQGSHMLFITAGMGGGTGTGAAPVIAKAAREHNILTVAVVTKPFNFEGSYRIKLAEQGLAELQKHVDTLIVIPNQNLFRIANEKTTFADAFKMADNVLHEGVRSITDLIINPGLINLDYADVKTIILNMGKSMMGTGEAEGEDRALLAAQQAISNPLLDQCSLKGARGVLINITGGADMTLFEVDAAAEAIRKEVDPDANIIIGSAFDQDLTGKLRIAVIATGIDAHNFSINEKQEKQSNTGIEQNTYIKIDKNNIDDNHADSQIFNNQVEDRLEQKIITNNIEQEDNVADEDLNHKFAQESDYKEQKNEEHTPSLGLFGRMANSVKMKVSYQEEQVQDKSKKLEEVGADLFDNSSYDIPAYTRRKNK